METMDPTAENMRIARYRIDRRDQAHRQFLSAVKMLATVRNLIARTQTIQIELLNPPMVHSPAAPSLPKANGKQPQTRDRRANGTRDRFSAEATNPVVGGRINGHSRLANVLVPAGAASDGQAR